MTNIEARDRILAVLNAAGADGADEEQWCTDDVALSWAALAEAKRDLIAEGVIHLIWGDFYRLSDAEFARRILRDVGFEHAEREPVLIDRIVSILRGPR